MTRCQECSSERHLSICSRAPAHRLAAAEIELVEASIALHAAWVDRGKAYVPPLEWGRWERRVRSVLYWQRHAGAKAAKK